MEGLILNEQTKYVTYMEPIFEALGQEFVESLNWRITCLECGGSQTDRYSFDDKWDIWISGKELLNEMAAHPNLQWWWGLLQGFESKYTQEMIQEEEPVDIRDDITLWTLPVSMRNDNATIEIEAFDSTQTIVITKDAKVLEKLRKTFPKSELLSEFIAKQSGNKNLFVLKKAGIGEAPQHRYFCVRIAF